MFIVKNTWIGVLTKYYIIKEQITKEKEKEFQRNDEICSSFIYVVPARDSRYRSDTSS